jgi:hypothetical protein
LIASAGLVLVVGGSGIWLRRRALASSDATNSLRKHILQPTGAWLFAHWPALVGPLTTALGIGLLAFGIVQLSS